MSPKGSIIKLGLWISIKRFQAFVPLLTLTLPVSLPLVLSASFNILFLFSYGPAFLSPDSFSSLPKSRSSALIHPKRNLQFSVILFLAESYLCTITTHDLYSPAREHYSHRPIPHWIEISDSGDQSIVKKHHHHLNPFFASTPPPSGKTPFYLIPPI